MEVFKDDNQHFQLHSETHLANAAPEAEQPIPLTIYAASFVYHLEAPNTPQQQPHIQ